MENDVEGAELQGCGVVLVIEGTQTGEVGFAEHSDFWFAEVKGGSFLAAGQ